MALSICSRMGWCCGTVCFDTFDLLYLFCMVHLPAQYIRVPARSIQARYPFSSLSICCCLLSFMKALRFSTLSLFSKLPTRSNSIQLPTQRRTTGMTHLIYQTVSPAEWRNERQRESCIPICIIFLSWNHTNLWHLHITSSLLKGSYDAFLCIPFSLVCYVAVCWQSHAPLWYILLKSRLQSWFSINRLGHLHF